METNRILLKYVAMFGEIPPMIKMANYEDEAYQQAMLYAIYNNKKITYDNIKDFLNNNYDLVEKEDKKSFKTFKKGSK